MPRFSKESLAILEGCDMRLRRICEIAIRVVDFKVLEGKRGKEAQEAAFAAGKSKLRWPNSGHNTEPFSIAVDLAPFPIDWKDRERFFLLAGVIQGIAASLNIKIRWGGQWQNLQDLPHFELYGDA